MPAVNDSKLVTYASRAFFDDLLSAGAHILQFEGGLLHTKSVTIDDSFSLFGTVNLDMRSLHLNFELMLAVYDRGFNAALLGLAAGLCAQCAAAGRCRMARASGAGDGCSRVRRRWSRRCCRGRGRICAGSPSGAHVPRPVAGLHARSRGGARMDRRPGRTERPVSRCAGTRVPVTSARARRRRAAALRSCRSRAARRCRRPRCRCS